MKTEFEAIEETSCKDKDCDRSRRVSAEFVIDAIIKAVDGDEWPAAWQPDVTVHHSLSRDVLPVIDFLMTKDGRQYNELFAKSLDTLRDRGAIEELLKSTDGLLQLWDDFDESCTGRMLATEIVPLALGYASGLRTVGVSVAQSKELLRGFLRHYLAQEK